jgi:hypothetical protein
LIAWIQQQGTAPTIKGRKMAEQDAVFVEAIGWFPWYFLATVVLMIAFYLFRFGKKARPRDD